MNGDKTPLAVQAERFAKWWVDQAQEKTRGEAAGTDAAHGAASSVPAAAAGAPQRAYETLATAKQHASRLIDEERARVARQLSHAIVAAAKPIPTRGVRDEQVLFGLLEEVISAAKARLAGAQPATAANGDGDGSRASAVAKAAEGLAAIIREEVDQHLQQKLTPLTQQLKAVIESVQRDAGQRGAANVAADGAHKTKSTRMPKLKLSRTRGASGSRRADSGV